MHHHLSQSLGKHKHNATQTSTYATPLTYMFHFHALTYSNECQYTPCLTPGTLMTSSVITPIEPHLDTHFKNYYTRRPKWPPSETLRKLGTQGLRVIIKTLFLQQLDSCLPPPSPPLPASTHPPPPPLRLPLRNLLNLTSNPSATYMIPLTGPQNGT